MPIPPPDSQRRRRRLFAILIVLITSGGGSWIWLGRSVLPRRFAVVDEGLLFRSSQPTAAQLAEVIRRHGVKSLLIVREGGGERLRDELEFAQAHGLNVVHIPIQSQTRISDEEISRFWKCVDEKTARPILIHCSAGRHRTGFLCALYRIERMGWTVERAVDEMLSFGFDATDHAMILEQLKAYQPRTRASGGLTLRATTTASKTAREGA